MEWIEPKTDWDITDYFNIDDYGRIVNNIAYLKEYAKTILLNLENVEFSENIVNDKTYTSMIYASEINAIEDKLEELNLKTYAVNIGEKKTYYPNEKTMNYDDLNRIETACLNIFKTISSHINEIQRFPFTLGGQKGIVI
jgi:hypothetical protein